LKFYLTIESQERIRNTFINLNKLYILDVQEVLKELNLDLSKKSNIFLVNQHLERIIATQAKSKRLEGIIYINKNMTEKLIDSLYKTVMAQEKITGIVLMDDGCFPKLQHLHKLFEEVYFFPAVYKRVKILDCKILKIFEEPIDDLEVPDEEKNDEDIGKIKHLTV
jgi:hypothetical protein